MNHRHQIEGMAGVTEVGEPGSLIEVIRDHGDTVIELRITQPVKDGEPVTATAFIGWREALKLLTSIGAAANDL